MKYVMLIYPGTAPLPSSEQWAASGPATRLGGGVEIRPPEAFWR
jgi:hypothetical protein